LATFKSDVSPIKRFFGFGLGMTFATGNAATYMAQLFDEDGTEIPGCNADPKAVVRNAQATAAQAAAKAVQAEHAITALKDPVDVATGNVRAKIAAQEAENSLAIAIAMAKAEADKKAELMAAATTTDPTSAKEEMESRERKCGSRIKLTKNPFAGYFESAAVAPLVFTTDTTLGFRIEYLGSSVLPTALRMGFNRKEFAFTPLAVKTLPKEEGVEVNIASLLATIDNTASLGDATDRDENKIQYIQYFATGTAAEALAKQRSIRETLLKDLNPSVTKTRIAISILTSSIKKKLSALEPGSKPGAEVLRSFYSKARKDNYVLDISDFSVDWTEVPGKEKSAKAALLKALETPDTTYYSPSRQLDLLTELNVELSPDKMLAPSQ
jgi:hypothetical protein